MPSRPVSSGPADPVFARGFPGILGVCPSSNLEVKAVFPALSATVLPHAQEIVFRRGDSFDIDIQVQDDQDPPSTVSIAYGILRFAAKQGYYSMTSTQRTIGNEGAQILKRTYKPTEIEILDSANGKARIHIKKSDTISHPLVPLVWDIETTLPIKHLSNQPGTVTVQKGDPMVMGIGTDFEVAGIGLGDIIHVEGRYVMVLEVPHPQALKADFVDWTGGSGLTYNLYMGSSRTIASGAWTCLGDVVR